jgi:hypothetical protein
MMRRVASIGGLAVALVLAAAAPAFAHAELEPTSATGGTVADLELHLENEQSDAGTTQVDLRFPDGQPLVVAELPAASGWTATVEGGQVGSEATGITWTRPAASASPDDNPVLPLRLGPLPAAGGRLQFKVLQTYSNGTIDRWIEDWPAGAPEPDMPGPVLDVAAGQSPTSVDTTPGSTAATTSTTAATTTTTSNNSGDDDSNTVPIVLAIVAAVVVIGGGAAVIARRRRPTP